MNQGRTDFRKDPAQFKGDLAVLVDQVLASLADILEPDRTLIEAVLNAKFELDGRLGHWRTEDVAEVLDVWDALTPMDVPEATQVMTVGLVLRWLREEKLFDPETVGIRKPDYDAARLTPIGLWAAHQRVAEAGGDVLEIRQLAGRSAADVASRLTDASIEVTVAGWAAWVAALGESTAATELERAIVDAEDSTGRLGLLAGLTAAGTAGLAAGERLRAGGGIAGAMVTGYLVDQGVIAESTVSQEELALATADVLSAAADDEMLFEILGEGRSRTS